VALGAPLLIAAAIAGQGLLLSAAPQDAVSSPTLVSGLTSSLLNRPATAPATATATSTAQAEDQDSYLLGVQLSNDFAWPASGPLTSYFGPDHPGGIDIGLSPGDSPVLASAPGVVIFAGGDPCCEYGYHVILQHAGGMSTVYGHFSSISVAAGQQVRQGDVLGLGGNTGLSTGKHLHFEIRSNGAVQDPLRFLSVVAGGMALTSVQPPPASKMSCPSNTVGMSPSSHAALLFTDTSLEDFRISGVNVTATTQGGPSVRGRVDGDRGVRLDADPASAPSGKSFDYKLSVQLGKDDEHKSVQCNLQIKTSPSFPTNVGRITAVGTPGPDGAPPAIENIDAITALIVELAPKFVVPEPVPVPGPPASIYSLPSATPTESPDAGKTTPTPEAKQPTPEPSATAPPPTATAKPPTATVPPPTATEPPPTATPPPPTATPIPPTATHVPPTSTPTPEPTSPPEAPTKTAR
jgi:hypothetical protein